MHIHRTHIFILSIILLLAAACSTQKNTFVSRAYHNTTSRYNIYFNAREAYKSGMVKIEKNYKEPYNHILPVFYYKQKDLLPMAKSDMNRTLEKCTKLIKEHSITTKPAQKRPATTQKQKDFYNQKEYNTWIDDSYLLMGKAYFFQENYFEAQKSFLYILNEYKNKPIRHDANIWLARTKIEMQQVDDAKEILEKTLEDKEFPASLLGEAHSLFADIYLQQKKYEESINHLHTAIANTRKKRTKIRLTYILAQLYQETGDNTKAIRYFKQVENMNPPYEMAFNAKINQATAYESGSGSSKEVIQILQKLLRDEKNKEYKDQIYFAIANVYYAENDENKALSYYIKSVESSSSNIQQKAISYLSIGSIYYNQKKYIQSQPYYDSCISILPKDYRNFTHIKTTSENLNVLAYNYHMAQNEDSLQRIAAMSPQKRNEFIDNIIAKLVLAEQKAREQEEIDNLHSNLYNQEFGHENQKIAGSFYFYNESVVKFGKAEFKKRWGDRKLEDNWRRSSKNASLVDAFDSGNDVQKTTDEPQKQEEIANNKTRSYYLQNLPLNDSLLQISNKKIEEGMFNTAMAYMNLIGDNKFAIAALEKFITRFPNSYYTPIALYHLHLLHIAEKNFSQAEGYKTDIINTYPESNYAKALTNPQFYNDIKNKNRELEKDYADCYRAYIRNDFSTVISQCKKHIETQPDSYLLPKFHFLLAMSEGKLHGVSRLKTNLETVIAKYPKDEVSTFSKKILEYLAQNDTITTLHSASTALMSQSKETAAIAKPQELYLYKEQGKYLFVIAAKSEFVDPNKVKFNLINYNLDYFTNFNFAIDVKELNSKSTLISVSTLQNQKQAMNYFDLVNYTQEVFEGLEKVFTNHFIISEEHYKILVQDRDVEKYLKFFEEYYSR